MQNLRDKLLKAGLVTEKQIETALIPPKKQERNQRPPQRPAPSQRALASRVQTEEERQRAEASAALAEAGPRKLLQVVACICLALPYWLPSAAVPTTEKL